MQLGPIRTVAAVFGFCLGSAAAAPARIVVVPTPARTLEEGAADRKLAEAVVRALSACDAAAGADLDVLVTRGSVTLSGSVGREDGKRTLMEVVRGVEGVDTVKDLLDAKSVGGPAATPPATAPNATAAANFRPFKPPAPAPVGKASDRKSFDKGVTPHAESGTTAATRLPTSTAQPRMPPRLVPVDTPDDSTSGRMRTGAVVAESQPSEAGHADAGIAVIGRGNFERRKRAVDIVRPADRAEFANDEQINVVTVRQSTPQFVVPTQAVDLLVAQPPSSSLNPRTGQLQVDPMPIGPKTADNCLPLPPNVWPPYAPYSNTTPVAGPDAISSGGFPLIGPYYPDPKVPLGWRKVTLEWQDGHWWLGRKQAPIDYWRARFGY